MNAWIYARARAATAYGSAPPVDVCTAPAAPPALEDGIGDAIGNALQAPYANRPDPGARAPGGGLGSSDTRPIAGKETPEFRLGSGEKMAWSPPVVGGCRERCP